MIVKRGRLSLLVPVFVVLAAACGAGQDIRPAGLDEVRTRVSSLTSERKYSEAVAAAEAFLQRNPAAAHAHLLMTETLALMAETTAGPERTKLLERTATHHERVVELTKESTLRDFSLGALVSLHDARYLNRLDRAEMYARRIITETPAEAVSYQRLVSLFKSAKRFDDAARVLSEARKTVSTDPYQQAHLGDLMVELADSKNGASLDTRRRLLEQAHAIADDWLKANPARVEAQALQQLKSQATKAQAQLERDRKQ